MGKIENMSNGNKWIEKLSSSEEKIPRIAEIIMSQPDSTSAVNSPELSISESHGENKLIINMNVFIIRHVFIDLSFLL